MAFDSLHRYEPIEKNESGGDVDSVMQSTYLQGSSFAGHDFRRLIPRYYHLGQREFTRAIVYIVLFTVASAILFLLGWTLRHPSPTNSSAWSMFNS